MRMKIGTMSLLCMMLQLCSCSSGNMVNNSTVNSLDLEKYLGTWYELARFDHGFERGMNNCIAVYSMNDDGTIAVTNRGLKRGEVKVSSGKAKVTETPGLLRVSFFWPIYSDYRVMMVDDEYQYALVGGSNSDYLWILGRQPEMPEDVKDVMLKEAQKRGYNISALIWVDQSRNYGYDSMR